jgi:hypothetical protein
MSASMESSEAQLPAESGGSRRWLKTGIAVVSGPGAALLLLACYLLVSDRTV